MLKPKAQREYNRLINDIVTQWQINLHTDHRPSVDILRPPGAQSFHMDVLRQFSSLAHQFPTQRDTALLLLQQLMQQRAVNPGKGIRTAQQVYPVDLKAVPSQLQAIVGGAPIPTAAPLPATLPVPASLPVPVPSSVPVAVPALPSFQTSQPTIATPVASLQTSLGALQVDPSLTLLSLPQRDASEENSTSQGSRHASLQHATSVFETAVREVCASALPRHQGQEDFRRRLESHIQTIHSVVRAVASDLENTIEASTLSQLRSTQPSAIVIESSSHARQRVETSAAASNPEADNSPAEVITAPRHETRALLEFVSSSSDRENSDWIPWDFVGVRESVLDKEIREIEESRALAADE